MFFPELLAACQWSLSELFPSSWKPGNGCRKCQKWICGLFMQVDDTEVINFLLSTEIIPLCLRTMEMGSELSKTVSRMFSPCVAFWESSHWCGQTCVNLISCYRKTSCVGTSTVCCSDQRRLCLWRIWYKWNFESIHVINCRRFHNSIDMCVFGGFNVSILFYGVSDSLYNSGQFVLVTGSTISFTLGLGVLSLRSISSKKLSSGKYLLGVDGRLQHS